MGSVNLVLTIFAVALALVLTILVVTWCTVLAALREGLADEEEPLFEDDHDAWHASALALVSEPAPDPARERCLTGACREAELRV